MLQLLLKVFSIGMLIPETNILSSASKSKCPDVSTLKLVIALYGIE